MYHLPEVRRWKFTIHYAVAHYDTEFNFLANLVQQNSLKLKIRRICNNKI